MIFALSQNALAQEMDSVAKDKIIEQIQLYFDNLGTIDSDFLQEDQSGLEREGRFVLAKPNKMKIDYYSPEAEMLLLDGDDLIHYNKDLKEVSYVSSENLPLVLFAKKSLDFKNDLSVLDINDSPQELSIDLAIEQNESQYTINLQFSKNPLNLSIIAVTAPDGAPITMKLIDAKFNELVDPEEFEFRNPNFFND